MRRPFSAPTLDVAEVKAPPSDAETKQALNDAAKAFRENPGSGEDATLRQNLAQSLTALADGRPRAPRRRRDGAARAG